MILPSEPFDPESDRKAENSKINPGLKEVPSDGTGADNKSSVVADNNPYSRK